MDSKVRDVLDALERRNRELDAEIAAAEAKRERLQVKAKYERLQARAKASFSAVTPGHLRDAVESSSERVQKALQMTGLGRMALAARNKAPGDFVRDPDPLGEPDHPSSAKTWRRVATDRIAYSRSAGSSYDWKADLLRHTTTGQRALAMQDGQDNRQHKMSRAELDAAIAAGERRAQRLQAELRALEQEMGRGRG